MEITAITRNHMYGELHNPFCNLQKLRAWKTDDNKCKLALDLLLYFHGVNCIWLLKNL